MNAKLCGTVSRVKFCGSPLNPENHEYFTSRKIPAIRYAAYLWVVPELQYSALGAFEGLWRNVYFKNTIMILKLYVIMQHVHFPKL